MKTPVYPAARRAYQSLFDREVWVRRFRTTGSVAKDGWKQADDDGAHMLAAAAD